MARPAPPHVMQERQAFAARLRSVLGDISHAQLAEELDVSRYAVDGWTCGKAIPHRPTLERLALRLKTTASWLRLGVALPKPTISSTPCLHRVTVTYLTPGSEPRSWIYPGALADAERAFRLGRTNVTVEAVPIHG